MKDKKNRNIIYKVIEVVAFLVVGEGVLGWAVYWPVLWFLLDWDYIYWLAFILGILLVGFLGWGIGLTSLVMVGGVWLMKMVRDLIGGRFWLSLLAVIAIAWLANLLMSLKFLWLEAVMMALVMFFYKLRSERDGDIRV